MPALLTQTNLHQARARIAHRVRELRKARQWTQAELAQHLQLSQNRLSEIERGDGSFTAEQFLLLLRLFNVPPGDFVGAPPDKQSALQNDLARLGASHLLENSDVVPTVSEQDAIEVIRETLVTADSPRLIAGLAPVLIRNHRHVNLNKLQAQLADAGYERRLSWLVENTLVGLRAVASKLDRKAAAIFRSAEARLDTFLEFHRAHVDGADSRPFAPDILDANVRSKSTVRELVESASEASRRWGIVTALQPEDFAQALRDAARVAD